MKINDKVITPDGPGIIVDIDLPDSRAKKFIVKPDDYLKGPIQCYFQYELKLS